MHNYSLYSFMRAVRNIARTATGNEFAGTTDDEIQYMQQYYKDNHTTPLKDAVAVCAFTMVEIYRPSEVHHDTIILDGTADQSELIH